VGKELRGAAILGIIGPLDFTGVSQYATPQPVVKAALGIRDFRDCYFLKIRLYSLLVSGA